MKEWFLDVGQCIYCGDKAPALTREHVLPRGLGGGAAPDGHSNALVLQNASCERCRCITQKIEEQCLVSMMGPGRAKIGLVRKDRARKTTKAVITKIERTNEERELDWNFVPGPVVLPSFYEATELSGKPTPEVAPFDAKMIVVAPPTRAMHGVASGIGVTLNFDSQVFAQMLAKIALGVAVARLGVSGFEPFIQELIIGNPNEYGRWVGGFAGLQRINPPTSDFHSVALLVRPPYVIVEICLFASYGGPSNYVLVGRPR